MDIDQEAPIVAAGSVEVSASPQDVWAVLNDIGAWPSWSPGVREARLEGTLAPGTRFRWRSGRATITSVLTVVEPVRELAWTGTSMGLRAVHVWRIEPAPAGSRVTTEESWDGWPARLLHDRMERTLRRSISETLHSLKTEVEFRARREWRLAA